MHFFLMCCSDLRHGQRKATEQMINKRWILLPTCFLPTWMKSSCMLPVLRRVKWLISGPAIQDVWQPLLVTEGWQSHRKICKRATSSDFWRSYHIFREKKNTLFLQILPWNSSYKSSGCLRNTQRLAITLTREHHCMYLWLKCSGTHSHLVSALSSWC